MSDLDRPGSGHSGSASQHSYYRSSSSECTAVQPAAAPAAAPLATTDTFDRFTLMYTGPDGTRNHQVKRMNGEYIGTGERSFERTGNLGYMFRMPKEFPFPKGKCGRLGEIGAEIELWNIKKGL